MPRNESGVFSRIPGTEAVADTTISSAAYNATIEDLVADANAARPVSAGGTGAATAAAARASLFGAATLAQADGGTGATTLGAAPVTPTGGVADTLANHLGGIGRTVPSSSDVTLLSAALAAFDHVVMLPGDTTIDANTTIAAGKLIEFRPGARLVIGAGVVLTINGRILAGAQQQIFAGDLIRGSYVRIGDTPYDFGVRGTPQIPWATPQWFGAAVDGATDDAPEINAAVWFGTRCYLPAGNYLANGKLQLRLDGQEIFGDGYNSVITAGASTALGEILGIRGDFPTTAGGDAARYVSGAAFRNLRIDGSDRQNANGIGVSCAKDFIVDDIWFDNIGRKAFTAQYHVHGGHFRNYRIREAAQESGSTHAAISIEGQTAGLDYTNDGGFNGVDDLFGADVTGIEIGAGQIYASGYNHLVLQRCTGINVKLGLLGDAVGNGGHVILSEYAQKCHVQGGEAGNSARRFIYADALSSDNTIEGFRFGTLTSAVETGYALHDEGARNKYLDIRIISHANTATAQACAVLMEGADALLDRVVVVSTTATSAFIGLAGADRLKLIDCESLAPVRAGRFLGDDTEVRGGRFLPGAVTQGLVFAAPRAKCSGARISGSGTNRIQLEAAATGSIIEGNFLLDAGQINAADAALWSGIKANNIGDQNSAGTARVGIYSLWPDSTGDLRIVSGDRTSDTDGTVTGSQS